MTTPSLAVKGLTMNGGSGQDVAQLSGNSSDYSIAKGTSERR